MKKTSALLAIALACAFTAPAFASTTRTASAPDQVVAKKSAKKAKASKPKAPKAAKPAKA